MDLSIIIVNWNTRELLAQCLESIFSNPPHVTFQVLVVDNASNDNSAGMVRERFPAVCLIENGENRGFARANNQAIQVASGRYLLLLNSDTIVQPKALDKMVSFMDGRPDAGIVGAYLLGGDGSPDNASYGQFRGLWSECTYAWGLDSRWPFSRWLHPTRNGSGEYLETGWVLGAAMLIRRAALDQVGVLDEDYFIYSEEVDLAYRVHTAGWKNYVLLTAPIIHLGSQSTRQVPAPMKAALFRSKRQYLYKHQGQTAAQVAGLAFGASILARVWVYGLMSKRDSKELWSETWQYYTGRKTWAVRG